MSTTLLLRGLIVCGLLLCGCQRDIRKLHIEKRIYRPGWYVSIPPRGEPITHAYPPPVQTPVIYPASVPQPRQSSPPQTTPAAVPSFPSPPGGTAGTPPATPLPSPPLPPPVAQVPQPPVAAPPQANAPPVADSAVAAQPSVVLPDSSGSRNATVSRGGVDVEGGFRVFAAGLMPAGGRHFPLAAGAGFAGGGYTLAFTTGPRLAVLASCSYRYARLPVKQTPQRPLPLPETAAANEKIRLHSFCTETALHINRTGGKFISSIEVGLGIERIVRSVYMARNIVQQPLPASGQQSVAVTKIKATGLYSINAWSSYMTCGISHAGWRVFLNCRINKQTTHETDFPRVALGVSYSTFDF
ncbi:MAG: hypothetical protein IM638_03970 [Bacteroidetes bacterium]|nr:hypothetical protein [Bacteroidota bacterium]